MFDEMNLNQQVALPAWRQELFDSTERLGLWKELKEQVDITKQESLTIIEKLSHHLANLTINKVR